MIKFRPLIDLISFVFQTDSIKNIKNKKLRSLVKYINSNRDFQFDVNSLEAIRNEAKTNNNTFIINDLGAGSRKFNNQERKISEIATTSVSSRAKCMTITNLLIYIENNNIIELGTSLGIMTSYLASFSEYNKIYTFEGVPQIANYAKSNFSKLNLNNIDIITGNFDDTLAKELEKIKSIGFALIDGNHRKESTLKYFDLLASKLTSDGIIVVDDNHWSVGMNEAWNEIINRPFVSASIDLYKFGIVFVDPELKGKHNIICRQLM